MDGGTFRVQAVESQINMKIVNYGASGAIRLTDSFWLGLGVSVYDFGLNSEWTGYQVAARKFEPANFAPEFAVGTRIHTADDWSVRPNIGVLYNGSRNKWSVGAVYRAGPSAGFEVDADDPTSPVRGSGTFNVP